MRFWTFTHAFESFRRFRRVVTCCNWTSSDAVASLLSEDMFRLSLVLDLRKFEETLLTATHIAVTLTFK